MYIYTYIHILLFLWNSKKTIFSYTYLFISFNIFRFHKHVIVIYNNLCFVLFYMYLMVLFQIECLKYIAYSRNSINVLHVPHPTRSNIWLYYLQMISSGRYGKVWKASCNLDRTVAVKVFNDRTSWRKERDVYLIPQVIILWIELVLYFAYIEMATTSLKY